jgi:hypothetical protein
MSTTPMSPNVLSSWWETYYSTIVATVTMEMNHCTPVNLSFIDLIGTMEVPRPGWKVTRRRI